MAQQHVRPPFSPFHQTESQTVYSGPMSYNAGLHGSMSGFPAATPFPALVDPSTLPPDPTYYDISVATHKQIASIQAKLDQKLGPEYISQRPGPGGGPKLTYAEGWKIINLANEVFGFNGWSSSICSMNVDYLDPLEEGRRWNCGVSAVVRVTLRDGVYHEDVGYGAAENIKNKGAAIDKCKKEAVTDAIKRTLRNFGNLMGNCLYDKQYTQEIVKIKIQPPKFDRGALHRRPEFEEKADTDTSKTKKETASEKTASTEKSSVTLPPQSTSKVDHSPPLKSEPATPGAHAPAPEKSLHTHPAQERLVQHSRPLTNTSSVTKSSTTIQQSPAIPTLQKPSADPDEGAYYNSEDDALFMQLDMDGVNDKVTGRDDPKEIQSNKGNTLNQGELSSNQLLPRRSSDVLSAKVLRGPVPDVNADETCKQAGPVYQRPQQLHAVHNQPQAEHTPQRQAQAGSLPRTKQPDSHVQTLRRPSNILPKHLPQRQASDSIQIPAEVAIRSVNPLIGKSNFSPEADASMPHHVTRQHRQRTSIGQGLDGAAGVKRSADVMSPHTNHQHTPNNSNMTGLARTPSLSQRTAKRLKR